MKLYTVIKTTQWPSWVVHTPALQIKMVDSRHFEKKIEKSPYLSNSLIDCHKIWYADAH